MARNHNAAESKESLARGILGEDIIFPREISLKRGLVYNQVQLRHLLNTLPAAHELNWCKERGCVVIAAPPEPMSLIDVYSIESDLFHKKGCYSQGFSRADRTTPGWIAIKKTLVEGSTNRNWQDQQRCLLGSERVPNAAEASWFITTFLKVSGVKLLTLDLVRTASVLSPNGHVCVGGFDAGGLHILGFKDNHPDPRLGLLTAREF